MKNLEKYLFEGEADEAKRNSIETFDELTEDEMNSLLDDLNEDDDLDEDADLDEDELDEDDELSEAELNEDELNEDESSNDSTMSNQDIKVESLKIATNIAKLMSDVTTEDIISIADKVADFIRNHNIGNEVESKEIKSKEDEESKESEDLDFEIPEAEEEK